MAFVCSEYKIIEKKALAKDIFSLTIFCPEAAKLAKCGQFVHIRVNGFTLRRPISICETDREKGTIRIVYVIKGEGTKALSKLEEGDTADIIAPLGNGFSVGKLPELLNGGRVLLLGGGIGVPPLLQTAKCCKESFGAQVTALLGFRSYENIILEQEFKQAGANVIICTDDGSVGIKGTIAEPLKAELEKGDISAVFACGPTPMLKAAAQITKEYEVFCELSLEERMGCGVGACVGCAVRISRDGDEKMLRVCKEGPVFNASEVIF